MDAGGDEQAVDPDAARAGKVGPQAVADGEDAALVDDAEQREAGVEERGDRLAVPAHAPAERLVALRQRAGADGETPAMADDEVGIGADHRQVALPRRLHDGIVMRRLLPPAPGPGVENEIRGSDGGNPVPSGPRE